MCTALTAFAARESWDIVLDKNAFTPRKLAILREVGSIEKNGLGLAASSNHAVVDSC
jgi:hypothetical protein